MNKKISIFILMSLLLLCASPSIALVAKYQKAVDVYKRGDYKTSYRLILPLANKGFSQAQYNLGVIYLKGKGVKVNLKKAKKWFELAAEQGVVKAQNKLGLMYVKGMGVAKNYGKAIDWWNLAAAQGNGIAQTNLGWMHETGKGVPKDAQKAANWYQLASNQGIAKAQKRLNFLLDKTNLFDTAINLLGRKEFATALQLFTDLAGKGMAEAQINLGMMFEGGQGVPQDFKEAIRWYRLAADQGLIKAQEKLNLLVNKAAEAQINFGLGVVFETGQGVPQDFKEAIKWYQLAADQGLVKAQEKLNKLLNKQYPKKIITRSTNQTISNVTVEKLASISEFESSREKYSTEIKNLQTTATSLRSELEQIKLEKVRAIKAKNQAIAKVKEEMLASISEFESSRDKYSTEITNLQTTATSLRSESEQIKLEKVRAIEANSQAIAKLKLEKRTSINEFESSREKYSTEIRNLQTTATSLRSELEQIKLEKVRAIETNNQVTTKVKVEKLARSNGKNIFEEKTNNLRVVLDNSEIEKKIISDLTAKFTHLYIYFDILLK
jgi:uncharacterized protein